jgi:tyrosinase
MRAHEILLQDECGYTGVQPYWDELSDAESAPLNESSVFDPETRLGNELDGAGCVINGPFAQPQQNQ